MRLGLILLVAFYGLACESSSADGSGTGDGVCPFSNPAPDRTKKAHGETCDTNDECQYGTCHTSPFIGGTGVKFCTKQCDCGTNSTCSEDNEAGKSYTCFRSNKTDHPGESITSFCVPTCGTDGDCPSALKSCTLSSGSAVRICHN